MVMVFGVRERALAEHQAEQERRATRDAQKQDATVSARREHTEELVRQVFGPQLAVQAPAGFVVLDGLTIGARWSAINGHYSWRLCLLETCANCNLELVTPFVTVSGLGAILEARNDGMLPIHAPAGDCMRGKVWR